MSLRSRTGPARADAQRGVTIIEAVVAILVLAIAVPIATAMLTRATTARVDAADATRGVQLASTVMEQLLADVASPDAALGMAALEAPEAYVDGLRDRLAGVTSFADPHGIAWDVQIGPLVDAAGASTGDPRRDLYRSVTVTAAWTGADGAPRTLSLAAVVGDATP